MDTAFTCPITGETMKDPVVDPDGNSYERSAILDWLSRNHTSPLTRTPLRAEQLVPNRALLDLLESQGLVTATTPNNRTKNPLSLLLTPKVTMAASYDPSNECALLQIQVQDDASSNHRPATVVCVLDVSYSMDSPATMHNDTEGSAGLSLLDVVKHATRTIIETLTEHDQLAVVSYADKADVVLPLMHMTSVNRQTAWAAVDSLRTRGSTNLWGGLFQALELVRQRTKNVDESSNNSDEANILLLTDGMPNIHPPRGELPTLARYLDQHPGLVNCRISTFGFGYSLDSPLLKDISVAGKGYFGFIPDSSFVGTVFINAAANILATAVPESTLSLEAADGVKLVDCLSGQSFCQTDWGMEVSISSLLYGQTFQVLVSLKTRGNSAEDQVPQFVARLKFLGERVVECASVNLAHTNGNDETMLDNIRTARVRSALIRLIQTSEETMQKSGGSVAKKAALRLVQTDLSKTKGEFAVTAASPYSSEALTALGQDLNGQITEAYSQLDWYNRWGGHYLLSLARAHVLQQCSNFKDPGVQSYATPKFSQSRDVAEGIFCQLPPPKPSLSRDDNVALPSMRSYHNSNAPCFAAGQVRMADGWNSPVDTIRVGDLVATSTGSAKVECVVVTQCEYGVEALVQLDEGVLVTPWHPVRVNGSSAWEFPANIASTKLLSCARVYSFVLEQGASDMIIGPYEAVTLGHNISDDPVATHAYLGTNRVRDDLSRMAGWNQGLVLLDQNPAVRDPVTHLITSFRQYQIRPKRDDHITKDTGRSQTFTVKT